MTESERLIGLIRDYTEDKSARDIHSAEFDEQFADYLIKNGVIVLPCKVGDTVYILAGHDGRKYEKDICVGFYIGEDGVVQVRVINKKGNHGTYGVMGKTVFLTREEAEKALKKNA